MAEQQPIPIPVDFPVAWDDPEHEKQMWIQDKLHQPYPITPLSQTLITTAFSVGASAAIARLSMPVTAMLYTVQNGYPYLALPPFMSTPEEFDARFAEMQRLTMELGSTVYQDWLDTFLPQVEAHCDTILNFDYDSPSTTEVAAFVASFYDIVVDLWDIHMRVNIPPMNAVFGFEEFLSEVLGPEAATESRLLQQGFDNKSIETGKAIWTLSRWIREDASFQALLESAGTVDGVVQVGDHQRSAEFNERWQAFLDVYGWRSDKFIEIGHPSWREEQGSALNQLKAFVAKPDDKDPYASHRAQAANRDALVDDFEQRLPEPARPQFRAMVPLVQYIPIAEDHNFAIDQRAHAVIRHGVQQLGRRLEADGLLPSADDVFYLTLDEIAAFGGGDAAPLQTADVAARRALRTERESLSPPLEIGTPPPPEMPPNPLIVKFFGYEPGSTQDGNTITGKGCSPGTVTGIAKVVLTLDQSDKLEDGEILVCPMTMPAWTPLFGVAAAVVADAGGELSHCAIVAREYGIPCVAGTKVGTEAIKDGMRITVDGDAGTVEILG